MVTRVAYIPGVPRDIDFAAEGLLDGLDEDAIEPRAKLLERLLDEGYELEELRDAARFDLLPMLHAEAVVGGRSCFTLEEVAERSGMSAAFIAATRRANGMPVPDADAKAFNEADLENARRAREFADAGLTEAQMLATARVLGRGMAQAAEVMRSVVLEMALEPGADELQLAESYRAVAEQLVPMTTPLVEGILRLHLRNVIRTEAVTAAERASGRLSGAREVTIGFADLVGFTRLGEELPPDELGDVASRLEGLAAEVIEPPVRLVKTIGDAAMLMSPESAPLVDCTLALVAAADAEGESFPQLRAGLAHGPALSRAGDWYGRPVNLASRITAVARPGTVLVTGDVRDAAPDGHRYSFAGARAIKGVPGQVKLFRARPLEAEPPRDG